MWKVIVAVVVLGIIAYRFGGSGTPVLPGATAPALYDGYAEARLLLQAGQREIELVAIEERPEAAGCENGEIGRRLAAKCPSKTGCRLKSFDCTREIEPRYRKMLEGSPTTVHYAHLQADDGVGGTRRGVLLGWGLTEQESMMVCNGVVESTRKDQKFKGTATCI